MELAQAELNRIKLLKQCLRLMEDENLDELHGDLAECIRAEVEPPQQNIDIAWSYVTSHFSGTKYLIVYPFDDAPQILQDLSNNGGDEDWLLIIPPEYKDRYIGWAESDYFGCSDIRTVHLGDWTIKI